MCSTTFGCSIIKYWKIKENINDHRLDQFLYIYIYNLKI